MYFDFGDVIIMKRKKLIELFNFMYEFMPLYHQTMGQIYKKDYDIEPELNKNQQRAIFIIRKYGRISPTTLGKCLDMQKGSLTTLVDSLEGYGIVERVGDKKDRRRQWSYLTEEGKRYIKLLMGKFKDEFIRIFDGVDYDDIKKTIESFECIKVVLQNIKMTGEVLCK
mgnify:FL=1